MSDQEFDREAGPPAYLWVKVAEHLAQRIKSGNLPPHTMLPAEKALAQDYGVSVGTARRATERLRELNLVVTLPGKGTFVLDRS